MSLPSRGRAGWLLVVAAVLLGGCHKQGYFADDDPKAPAACEREADADPTVRELRMKMAGTAYLAHRDQEALAFARRDVLLKCLRAKGLIPPGGVEAVRPTWYGPLF